MKVEQCWQCYMPFERGFHYCPHCFHPSQYRKSLDRRNERRRAKTKEKTQ